MTTAESLRTWFLQCPIVEDVLSFNADYLGEEPNECSIYMLPSNLAYTEDILGNISYNKRQTLQFSFAMRLHYGDDAITNLENLDKLTAVQSWVYENNTSQVFPEIEEGEVVSIIPIKTPVPVSASADSAIYELICELKYERADV